MKIEIGLGGGPMVWQTGKCRPAAVGAFVDYCVKMGWRTVHFKLMNRSGNLRHADIRFFEKVTPLLRAKGIEPCAWVYTSPEDAYARGKKFGELCRRLGVRVACNNAEIEFKTNGANWEPGRAAWAAAREWLCGFRENGGADVYLGLSTFAQPRLHRRFPYKAFLTGKNSCDWFSAQCYGSKVLAQLLEAWEFAQECGVDSWPCLRAYVGDGRTDRKAIVEEVGLARAFMKSKGILRFMWWHWASAQDWPEMLAALEGEEKDEGRRAKAEGELERAWQRFLNERGAGLVVDGDFGAKSFGSLRVELARIGVGAARIKYLESLAKRSDAMTAALGEIGG